MTKLLRNSLAPKAIVYVGYMEGHGTALKNLIKLSNEFVNLNQVLTEYSKSI